MFEPQSAPSTSPAARRSFYSGTIAEFCGAVPDQVLGEMARRNSFELVGPQRDAWIEQTTILQGALGGQVGRLYLEFTIPRLGSRVDAIAIIGPVLFVIEFKVGEGKFKRADLDQVVDYALDLRNFHEGSHEITIAPILVCTEASSRQSQVAQDAPLDRLFKPSTTNGEGLRGVINSLLQRVQADSIAIDRWEDSGYKPTPTIVEATLALYRGHSVADISRNDAGAVNLSTTAEIVAKIVANSQARNEKSICFVTGVPGAGKTLVGLDAATKHSNPKDELYSVFLSGNGPLVAILREALARDRVARSEGKVRKKEARSEVKGMIQNVHHFRDDCLSNGGKPPVEHIAIFDEAQRAWNLKQTASFMQRKKGRSGFAQSEPEFLISCLDRHNDWAVMICLVGGGQEINTGEAGIKEWLASLDRSFPGWKIHVSDRLIDQEYDAASMIEHLRLKRPIEYHHDLHLATSMRSFRSEQVSQFVKEVLDLELEAARRTLRQVEQDYPIMLTRDLNKARTWLRSKALGSERYGIVVSSQAERLKPHAVDVRVKIDPVHWFLNPREDVRSSYYLEDVATEFHVQGLELDWTCVVWDADLRYNGDKWQHWSFKGSKWQHIQADDRMVYLEKA